VVVNGDVASADDAVRALAETGCAGVMIGRAAIDRPWIFREARALLDGGPRLPPPSDEERWLLYRRTLVDNVAARGENNGVQVTRRHLRGYLRGLPDGETVVQRLLREPRFGECLRLLDEAAGRAAGHERRAAAHP
jgi:tRNA-dihydrouridine synthase